MLQMINTTSGALTAAANIPFTTVVRNTNNNVSAIPASGIVQFNNPGLYRADAQFVVSGGATGNITIQAYANGVAIPGAVATATIAASSDVVELSIETTLNVIAAQSGNATLTYQLVTGSVATTLENANVIVEYVE